MKKTLLLLVFIQLCFSGFGQRQIKLPSLKAPTGPSRLSPDYSNFGSPVNGLSNVGSPSNQNTQPDPYEQSLREQQAHKRMVLAEIDDAERTFAMRELNYKLPSNLNEEGAINYSNALIELLKMNRGAKPLSIKRAVFLVENAYLNNTVSYTEYDNAIKKIVELCYLKAKQDKVSLNSSLAKNLMIYKYMSDTLKVKLPYGEKTLTHYPMTYDFKDYRGEKDPTKLFVMKLLTENTGQCHSMPLLFKILSEEMGSESYLSYAPSHSYVKVRDKLNNWYNIELTNGMLTTNAFIMQSGYVKTSAVKNKIFLDTVNTRSVLAQCIFDLGRSYAKKYGFDEFVLDCANAALSINPKNIFALHLKADYYTMLSYHANRMNGITTKEQLENDSKALEIILTRNKIYKKIDDSGYEDIPQEVYQVWLNSLKQEQNKQEHNKQYIKLKSIVK